MILQGREVSDVDIELIRSLMATHPMWGRTPLSVELCRRWNWRNAQGRLKDMAARTLKLERAGHIRLSVFRRFLFFDASRLYVVTFQVFKVKKGGFWPLEADF